VAPVKLKSSGLKIFTRFVYLLLTGCLFSCVFSCNIINPSEGIPSYLQVDTFTFSVVPGQGTSSNKITDVWVFDENTLLGAYEIPKTFPVPDTGLTTMILSAGIWDNGISETRLPYPFYFPDTLTFDLKSGKILPVTPHFIYRPDTKFYFIEDFEAGNLFSQLDGDTNMIRITDASEVFEGIGSGAIYLDSDHTFYQGRSASSYSFPAGQPVYLELNYKCDQPFQVGLFGTVSALSIFDYKWTINKKENWNKIYLDMGSDVNSLGATDYQILIKAVFDSTNTNSHIYLDNIKLVSF
jgi:hypothetical protein